MLRKVTPGLFVVLAFAMLFAVGCRKAAPVLEYTDQPVMTQEGKVTDAKVEQAIFRAAKDLKWLVRKDGSRRILATLNIRKHKAEVLITYNKEKYSITYVNSYNLEYENGMIHPQYNNWVKNLQQAIDHELAWTR